MITATLLLPLIGWHPSMAGVQPVSVVWVNTPRDRWEDTSEARAVLSEAFAWWERQVDVSFQVTESALTIDTDPYLFDICHDRSWSPSGRAIYMVAWEPTGRVFQCDGVNVADLADPNAALTWGGIRAPEMAHTIGHFYGALDTHAKNGQAGTADIMDRDVIYRAYERGIVAAETLAAIGAIRRAARVAPSAIAAGQRERGTRGYTSYSHER